MAQYKVTVGNVESSPFTTFVEAWAFMFVEVLKMVREGTSWQVLETACWIETDNRPIMFYDARDIACELQLMHKVGEETELKSIPPDQVATIETQALALIAGIPRPEVAMAREATEVIGQISRLTAELQAQGPLSADEQALVEHATSQAAHLQDEVAQLLPA